MPRIILGTFRLASSPRVGLLGLLLCLGCDAAPDRDPKPSPKRTRLEIQSQVQPHVNAAPLAQSGTAAAAAHSQAPASEQLAAASCGEHVGCAQAERGCGHTSCGQEAAPGHAACGAGDARAQASAFTAEATLTRVDDPSQVCMVRDHFMGRPQLAVEADGAVYFGCCAGCANRLLRDPRARKAIDPVSQQPVDKSLAVLARTARGSVLYFENETNLELFRATMR